MAIVGTLPVQLANGTLADATQVMSDFNYVVTQVNANAAGVAQANNFIGVQTIAGDTIVTATTVQTLTNKTISASGNLGTTGTGVVDLSVSANITGVAGIAIGVNNSASTNVYGIVAGAAYLAVAAGTLNAPLVFGTTNTERMRITNAGTIQDGAGLELGYKGLPNTIANNYVDRGKACALTAGTTVNTGVFNAGDTIVYYNDSAAAITITQGASVTLRLAGTTTTGNRTMAPRAICTLWYKSTGEVIISGAGLS